MGKVAAVVESLIADYQLNRNVIYLVGGGGSAAGAYALSGRNHGHPPPPCPKRTLHLHHRRGYGHGNGAVERNVVHPRRMTSANCAATFWKWW